LNLAFAGAVLGFLRFNWHPAKLFMGDAGSLSLGFTLAFMSLGMTQGDNACMSPISALLILTIPIADTLTVMTKRILQGTSPFHADKRHLHHIFMRYGFNRENTVKIIVGLSIILGSISILGRIYNVAESTLFLIFAIYLICYFISSFFILDLLRYSSRFRRKRDSCGAPCKCLKVVFQILDTLNIIPSNPRYAVSIPAKYYTTDKNRCLKGTITNISKSGFMASIPELTTLESIFFTNINFETQQTPNVPQLEFTIEHLWIATRDEKHIHGFKFKDLTAEQKSVLKQFTNTLKKSRS